MLSALARATACLLALLFYVPTAGTRESPRSPQLPASLPLTTTAPEALHLFEQGFSVFIDRRIEPKALELMRKAIQVDPDFAMGHEFLARYSYDPAEQVSEQNLAYALRNKASPDERTVIEWSQDAADHKLISAITKMNAVLHKYPHDKFLVWMAGGWLYQQGQYERAIGIFEHAGILDSPGLLNDAAYYYARTRRFDRACALARKNIAMMPNEANQEDTYGEILRMAGRFPEATEHYRAALAKDPTYIYSNFGIADTYSLMGDQTRAREEFEAAFHRLSLIEELWLMYRTREATTYVREGDLQAADRAFQAIADHAHERNENLDEAVIYRQMALYQQNSEQALIYLDKAEAALQKGDALKATLNQERARILRARVETEVKMGDLKTAQSNLNKLYTVWDTSQDPLIELAYHGAAGALFLAEGKYDEAVSNLEEDSLNPLSLKLLIAAYEKTNYTTGVKWASDILANFYEPTMEQAVIVPSFRKCLNTSTCRTQLNQLNPPPKSSAKLEFSPISRSELRTIQFIGH